MSPLARNVYESHGLSYFATFASRPVFRQNWFCRWCWLSRQRETTLIYPDLAMTIAWTAIKCSFLIHVNAIPPLHFWRPIGYKKLDMQVLRRTLERIYRAVGSWQRGSFQVDRLLTREWICALSNRCTYLMTRSILTKQPGPHATHQ